MAPLSDGQLASVARYGGFSLEESKVAVAIMLAESGGDPAAVNRNRNGSIDRGVFQINSIHGAKFPGNLHDPLYNATAARAIFLDAKGWSPWSTYKSGAYKQFLDRGRAAFDFGPKGILHGENPADAIRRAAGMTVDDIVDEGGVLNEAVDATAGPLGAIGDLASALSDPEWWKRVGVGAAGVAFIVVAGIWVLKDLAGPVAAQLPGPVGVAGKVLKATK